MSPPSTLILPLLTLSALASATHTSLPLRRAKRSTATGEDLIQQRLVEEEAIRNKYNIVGSTHAKVKKRATSGSVALAGNDLSYYTSISVGTPPVSYEVVLDTGSADLVLATAESNACFGTSNTDCEITASLYSPALSSSAVSTSQAVDITYGTGDASGVIVKDTMSFAGFTATQNIAACGNVTDLVTSSDQSGLWGLAFKSLSASNSMPFLQGLFTTNQLASPEFGFGFTDLSIDDTDPSKVVPGGTMVVGGVDSTLFSGNLNYVSLTASQYWAIPLQNIVIGGVSLGLTDPEAIIDTGTNGIVVASDVAAAIYGGIPGSQLYSSRSGTYLYPCSTQVQLGFTFGGVTYTIPASDFNYGKYSGSQCIGAVSSSGVPSTSSQSITILGTPFLFNLYNTYRFNPPAVGFATLATSADKTFSGQIIPTSNGTNTAATAQQTSQGSTGSGSGGGFGSSSAAGGVTPKGVATLAALSLTALVLAVGLV